MTPAAGSQAGERVSRGRGGPFRSRDAEQSPERARCRGQAPSCTTFSPPPVKRLGPEYFVSENADSAIWSPSAARPAPFRPEHASLAWRALARGVSTPPLCPGAGSRRAGHRMWLGKPSVDSEPCSHCASRNASGCLGFSVQKKKKKKNHNSGITAWNVGVFLGALERARGGTGRAPDCREGACGQILHAQQAHWCNSEAWPRIPVQLFPAPQALGGAPLLLIPSAAPDPRFTGLKPRLPRSLGLPKVLGPARDRAVSTA